MEEFMAKSLETCRSPGERVRARGTRRSALRGCYVAEVL
jgi:hypothetical protein